MNSKKFIKGLYAITDPGLIPDSVLYSAVENVIAGGARIVQYRNKQADLMTQIHQAGELSELCKKHQVTFIINDNPELALAINADGVHIGQQDSKISDARELLGDQAIIGASCYNQLDNAKQAVASGADYVAFGRFFASKTKPEAVQAELSLIAQAKRILDVPIVAIGGITPENAPSLISAGADAVAVIHSLFNDSHKTLTTALSFQSLFASHLRS